MMKKMRAAGRFVLFLFMTGFALVSGGRCEALAETLTLAEIGEAFENTILAGETTVSFETDARYTIDDIQDEFFETALSHSRLYNRSCQYERLVQGSTVSYRFTISSDAVCKVKVLKNSQAACNAAVTALKKSNYDTKFYSEKSYRNLFELMLLQHPEYNYDTVIWYSSDGTYGYHLSSELTESEQKSKVEAADKKADSFVKNKIKSGMTTRQKVKAIHDYIARRCEYDSSVTAAAGYEDSATAYGALVKGRAVCQGYAAAFNLLAYHCGIQSIAVCGSAGGGSHAWNCVKIGGRICYVDCTWDDTMYQNRISHDFFDLTADEIGRSHSWVKSDYLKKYLKYSKRLFSSS